MDIKQVKIYESKNKEKNLSKNGATSVCECCGKKLKNEVYSFHASTDWLAIPMNISRKQLRENGIESQGWFDIGPGCRNKFPKGYTATKLQ